MMQFCSWMSKCMELSFWSASSQIISSHFTSYAVSFLFIHQTIYIIWCFIDQTNIHLINNEIALIFILVKFHLWEIEKFWNYFPISDFYQLKIFFSGYKWCQLCRVLLHLLPEIHIQRRGVLLPQELWVVRDYP